MHTLLLDTGDKLVQHSDYKYMGVIRYGGLCIDGLLIDNVGKPIYRISVHQQLYPGRTVEMNLGGRVQGHIQ